MTKVNKGLLILLVFITFLSSCKNDCNCSENWDDSRQYLIDEKVSHNGKCWIAVLGGRGIEPGPFLENGNDVWIECE